MVINISTTGTILFILHFFIFGSEMPLARIHFVWDNNSQGNYYGKGSFAMRTKANRVKKAVLFFCLVPIILAGSVASAAETESDAAVTAGTNGIPVVSLTIDPEEFQEVNESLDHSYRAPGACVQIKAPEGYEGEFGEIDPDTTEIDLPLEYIRGRGNSTWLEKRNHINLNWKRKRTSSEWGKASTGFCFPIRWT